MASELQGMEHYKSRGTKLKALGKLTSQLQSFTDYCFSLSVFPCKWKAKKA